MKRVIFSLVFIMFIGSIIAKTKIDSVLTVLDNTIANKAMYNKLLEHEVDSIYKHIGTEPVLEKRYDAYFALFKRFRKYKLNEAHTVAIQRMKIAEELNDKNLYLTAKLNMIEVTSVLGKFKDALELLESIDKNLLADEQKSYFFHIYHSLYTRLFDYSIIDFDKSLYKKMIFQYKDSLLKYNEKTSTAHLVIKSDILKDQKRYDEALHILLSIYEEETKNNISSGGIANLISQVYSLKEDADNEVLFLAISSINDIKMSVKSYKSLNKLGVILYSKGYIDRAYRYIQCAIEDATFSGVNYRVTEFSHILPLINNAYHKSIRKEKLRLRTTLLTTIILFVMTLIGVILIRIKNNQLIVVEQKLENQNKSLIDKNNELDILNKKLTNSNRLKEAYLGSVFNIFSDYINRFNGYQQSIQKSLNEHKYDQIKRFTNQYSTAEELKDFYSVFDKVFLSLFPQFIIKINELLDESEVIIQKNNHTLTPELRVFALYRLGITDSSKIAALLHYSPQTVYNYKLKIHNKIKIDKEEFYKKILEIN